MKKYVNASVVLPTDLLIEIQKYTQGEYLYIPKTKGRPKVWGEISGIRNMLDERNLEIRSRFTNGESIEQLAEQFFLSTHSIKKIVYTNKY